MYPRKITPSPLVSSTIEIRFKTEKESNSIFKSFFVILSDKLTSIENTPLPKEVRLKNPEFKYYPEHIFSNDDYSLSFNENFIGFENISEYQLWDNYSNNFQQVLKSILSTNVIDEIERIGVRYQSQFDHEKIEDIIKVLPSMKIDEFDENFLSYVSIIETEGFEILLRLKRDITKSILDNSEEKGHLIDIDVSIERNVDQSEIFPNIQLAHNILKKTFFGLLKDDFIKTLNPEY